MGEPQKPLVAKGLYQGEFNHGLEVDDLIFGETFDGEDPETIKPLTKERLFKIKKVIQEKDPYATV